MSFPVDLIAYLHRNFYRIEALIPQASTDPRSRCSHRAPASLNMACT